MEIRVRGTTNLGSFDGTLTNEHDASNFGQPVLVVEGQVYRPDDIHPVYGMIGQARMSIDDDESSRDACDFMHHFYLPLCHG